MMPSNFEPECAACSRLLDTFGVCWSCGPVGMEKAQVLPGIELGMLNDHARLIVNGVAVGMDAAGLRVLGNAALVAAERLDGKSSAGAEVLAERARQITVEDHRRSEDDEYQDDELIHAAAAYLAANTHFSHVGRTVWPWHASTFKPTTPRRNLVKAAALILAEIERLDRAGLKASGRV